MKKKIIKKREKTDKNFAEVTGWIYYDQIQPCMLRNGAVYYGSWVDLTDGECYADASGGDFGYNCPDCTAKFIKENEYRKNEETPEFFADMTGWKTYGEIDYSKMCGDAFYFGMYISPDGDMYVPEEIEGEPYNEDDEQVYGSSEDIGFDVSRN